MNSSSFEGNDELPPVRLTAEQFEMLFQITKEFRSIPDLQLKALGVGDNEIDQLLRMVRSIRGRVEGVSCIQLNVAPGDIGDAPYSIAVVGSGELQARATTQGTISRRLMAAWDQLCEAAILSLGSRELFLRTGYSAEEIRQAAASLALG